MVNEIKMIIKVGKNDYGSYSKTYYVKLPENRFISEENVDLYVNNKIINFPNNSLSLSFSEEGKYNIIFKFKCYMKNCSGLFSNCKNLIHIDLTEFDPREITDMSKIFYDVLI